MEGKEQRSVPPSWLDIPEDLRNEVLTKLLSMIIFTYYLFVQDGEKLSSDSGDDWIQRCLCCLTAEIINGIVASHVPWMADGIISRLKFNKLLGFFHGWLLRINAHSLDTLILFCQSFGRCSNQHNPLGYNQRIDKVALSSTPADPNCTVIVTLYFFKLGLRDDEWTKVESDWETMDALVFRGQLYLLCSYFCQAQGLLLQ